MLRKKYTTFDGVQTSHLKARTKEALEANKIQLLRKATRFPLDGESSNVRLEDCYTIGAALGSGGFGTVYEGTNVIDNTLVAVKHIKKTDVSEWVKVGSQMVPGEVALMRLVSHVDGVIRLLDAFVNRDSFVLVLERPFPVQDLFDYITDKGSLEESEARDIMRQLILILVEVHAAGVLHRDIKDENILIELLTGRVRLIDFGSGAQLKPTEYTSFCGTRVYSPPEYIRFGRYHGVPAAVWSLGALLYDMVTGEVPFNNDDEIIENEIQFKVDVSQGVIDLVVRCLDDDPSERPSLEEILNDPWMLVDLSNTNNSSADTASADPRHKVTFAQASLSNFDNTQAEVQEVCRMEADALYETDSPSRMLYRMKAFNNFRELDAITALSSDDTLLPSSRLQATASMNRFAIGQKVVERLSDGGSDGEASSGSETSVTPTIECEDDIFVALGSPLSRTSFFM